MTDIRAEPITTLEITPEEDLEIYETLDAIEPPREAQRAIAKYQIQKAMRFGFSKAQHIHVATDIRPGRSWEGNIKKILYGKYGGVEGYCSRDLELEIEAQQSEEVIYK